MDSITQILLSPLPREVMAKDVSTNKPKEGERPRRVVKSLEQIARWIEYNNGKYDCFVSTYGITGEIDRITTDLDGSYAIPEGQSLYKHCIGTGLPTIPLISGRKGVHIHTLLSLQAYSMPKQLLTAATEVMIEKAIGSDNKSVDRTRVGDIRGMFRIPNTLRPPENNNWCTFLPPDFHKLSEVEVANFCKRPNYSPEYTLPARTKTLFDFDLKDIVPYSKESNVILNTSLRKYKPNSNIEVDDPIRFLEPIMRPCLFRMIQVNNPPHHVRVAAVLDLFNCGFTEQEIYSALSKLNWRDFDPSITKSRIQELGNSRLNPYSCSKLRKLGVPEVCCVR